MLHASSHSACLLKDLLLKEATYCASPLEEAINELSSLRTACSLTQHLS